MSTELERLRAECAGGPTENGHARSQESIDKALRDMATPKGPNWRRERYAAHPAKAEVEVDKESTENAGEDKKGEEQSK